MAFLKKLRPRPYLVLFLICSFLCTPIITFPRAWASSKNSIHPLVLVGSWRALKNCDWSHAGFWTKLLKKTDPQIATLYQLSWLQIAHTKFDNLSEEESPETWKWKQETLNRFNNDVEPELWIDEWNLISQTNQCSGTPQPQVKLESLPESFIHPLIGHLYSTPSQDESPKSLPKSLEATLKNYALYSWDRGNKIEILNQNLNSCDWDALRLLHSENPTEKKYEALLEKCNGETATLWAIVKLSLGDAYLKKGSFKKAFQLYYSSYDLIQDRKIPVGLDYRLVVSGLLSRAPDDSMLRTSSYLLSDDKLEPLYQSTLQNLVCETLSSLKPQEASLLLTRVFHSDHLVPQALILTKNCTNAEIVPLWKAIAPKVKTPRDKIQLAGRLLALSIESSSRRTDFQTYVQILAKGSHEHPFLASQLLWSAVSSPMISQATSKNAIAEEAIRIYRKHSNWLTLDEQRLKNRYSQNALALKSSEEKLQTDAQNSNSIIRLPMLSAELPPIKLSVHTQEDFLSGFIEESGIQVYQSQFNSQNPKVQAIR